MGATGTDLRGEAAVTGIGESVVADGNGHSAEALIYDACAAAIDDAGLTPDDVDGVVVEGEMMPETLPPDEAASTLGLDLAYTSESLPVGAGIAASPLHAAQAIRDGLAEHVLCYYGVNFATQQAELGAYEGSPYSYHASIPVKADLEIPFGWVTQPVYVAAHARRHMHEFGTTPEHLGEIAVQTRANAAENDDAHEQTPLTMDEYLDNRVIADPFRILDCCLISDGAGAFVVSATDAAASGPHPPVTIEGVGLGFDRTSNAEFMTQHADYTALPSKTSGPRAFEMAGITVDDVDFAELYDCFTITTLVQLEDYGFCEKGAGGQFVAEQGITVADGELPVNTHGGLLSHAYTLGITHVTEAVKQLRGDADNQVTDAETGLVSGWGDAAHATLVLGGEG